MSCRLEDVPLALVATFPGRSSQRFELQSLPCQHVVRALALAIVDRSGAKGTIKSNWTVAQYRNAVSRFARWLARTEFDGDLSDLTVDHLFDYGVQERATTEGQVRTLLRHASLTAGVHHPVTGVVLQHLDSPGISIIRPRSTPLEHYTKSETTRLESACKAQIREWERTRPRPFPSVNAMIAFRILIGLETGVIAEGLSGLHTTQIRREGDTKLHISYPKNRANGARATSVRGKGPWSSIGLIDRWIEASATLRASMGNETAFWIYEGPDLAGRVADFSSLTSQREGFLRTHALTDDNGKPLSLDLRRLRTTNIVRRERFWHGAISVDPTHSPTVEGDHYLTRSADPDVMDQTVEAAQFDVLRRAESVALVLASPEELSDAVDAPEVVAERGDEPKEWDMFAASCRDPFDSPFTAKGQFCSATAWSCLVCELAVITPAKLPSLLLLKDHIRSRSAGMTQADWLRVYGGPWVQLTTHILPKFSDRAIAAARSALDSYDLEVPVRSEFN